MHFLGIDSGVQNSPEHILLNKKKLFLFEFFGIKNPSEMHKCFQFFDQMKKV
jgi:hypothetical protein